MAIYKSNLVTKRNRHRGLYEGQEYTVAGRVFIPADTVLATDDVLAMVPVGENQFVRAVRITVLGDLGAATADVGIEQILDNAGNPVVVERLGPAGDADSKFESPATDPDYFAAAEALAGYSEIVATTVEKLTGPVNAALTIVTGGTAAEDTEVFLEVEFAGETGTLEVNALYPDGWDEITGA